MKTFVVQFVRKNAPWKVLLIATLFILAVAAMSGLAVYEQVSRGVLTTGTISLVFGGVRHLIDRSADPEDRSPFYTTLLVKAGVWLLAAWSLSKLTQFILG